MDRVFQVTGSWVCDTDRPGLWPEERNLPDRKNGRPPADRQETSSALVLLGRTLGGRSITCIVRGLSASLYLRLPPEMRVATSGKAELPPPLMHVLQTVKKKVARAAPGASVRPVVKMAMGEYGDGQTEIFLEVETPTNSLSYRARDAALAMDLGFEVIEPGRLFLRETVHHVDLGIKFSGLLEIDDAAPSQVKKHLQRSTDDLEIWLSRQEVVERGWLRMADNQLATAPLRVLSWDIEAISRGFPNPERPEDAIVCIGVQWTTEGTDQEDGSTVLCLDTNRRGWGVPGDPGEAGRRCFTSERQLIEAFGGLVRSLDADVLIGYNLLGFDDRFLWKRAEMFDCTEALGAMSRIRGTPAELREIKLSSAALGDNVFHQISPMGRITVDLMQWIKRNKKFRDNSLNGVCRELLADEEDAAKYSMPYELISTYYHAADDAQLAAQAQTDLRLRGYLKLMPPDEYARVVWAGTPEQRQVIVDELPKRYTMHRLAAAEEPVARADAGLLRRAALADYCRQDCALPIRLLRHLAVLTDLVQMSRVTSTSLVNILTRGQQIKAFSQIYTFTAPLDILMTKPPEVFCPLEGALVLDPITGLHIKPIGTLDFASLYPSIMQGFNLCFSTFKKLWCPSVDEPPNIAKEDRIDVPISEREVVTFVKPHLRKGILPMIEEELCKSRTATKRQMREFPKESAEYACLNGRQLALKISANSLYGVSGVADGAYSLVPVAAAITATGRGTLRTTKRLCETEMSDLVTRVVYGDSVTEDTPVTCRINGRTCVRTINDLPIDFWWTPYGDKEQAVTRGVEVWTERGWTRVRRVIRHRTDKEVFRVLTPAGAVDVTRDHGLLRPDGTEVSPVDVRPGDLLMTTTSPRLPADRWMTAARGRFVGALYAAGRPLLDYDGGEWWRSLLGHPRHKRRMGVPDQVLNAPQGARRAFLAACRDRPPETKIDAATRALLLESLGYAVAVGPDGLLVTAVEEAQEGRVTEVRSLGTTDRWVYDLETDNHHFAAGVGRLVVHNTDSVMVELKVPDEIWRAEKLVRREDGRMLPTVGIREAFRMGAELAERLNRRLEEIYDTKFLVLEFEQLFPTSGFLTRKRYFGSRFETVEISELTYFKGVQPVRRDASGPQRDAMQGAIEVLVYGDANRPVERLEAAVHAVQRVLQRFVDNDVPVEDYVMSKSLRESYAVVNAKGAHLTVRDKQKRRAPGSEPQAGNRVQFVICYDGCRDSSVSGRADNPDYVMDHELRPDRTYYMDHLLKCIVELLDPLLAPSGTSIARIARPYLERIAAQDAGAVPLTNHGPVNIIPLIRLSEPAPPHPVKTQSTLQFQPDGVQRERRRPTPAPPRRPKRKPAHAKLDFSKGKRPR